MKRDVKTNLGQAAKILGSRGGKGRARNLTAAQLAEIGRKGGEAKARNRSKESK